MEPLTIARIDRATSTVVNIEVATPEWVAAHADDPDFRFVPYTDDAPAAIGGRHDPKAGFQPPEQPDMVTVTRDELDALVQAGVAEALAARR